MENKTYWISPDDNVVLWSEPFVSHSSTYKKVIVYAEYEKLKREHEILKSRASQFESTILETIKYRDKAIEALKEINRKEMNSLRPGGSPSEVARISYEVLKEINRTKED